MERDLYNGKKEKNRAIWHTDFSIPDMAKKLILIGQNSVITDLLLEILAMDLPLEDSMEELCFKMLRRVRRE